MSEREAGGGGDGGKSRIGAATLARCCVLQRVLRFKSQQRDPLKRTAHTAAKRCIPRCHVTKLDTAHHRRYHLRCSHDAISLFQSNYASPLLPVPLLPFLLSLFLSFSSPSVSASLFVVANLLHDSFYFRDVRGFLVYVVSRTYVRIYANQLAQSICHLWSTTILPGRPGNASLTEAESHPSGDVSLNSRVIAWTSERERERASEKREPYLRVVSVIFLKLTLLTRINLLCHSISKRLALCARIKEYIRE